MRIIAVVLALVIAASGCATTTGRNALAVCAIASSIAVASTIAAQNEPTDSEAPPPAVYILGAALAVAAISGAVALAAEISATPTTPVVVVAATQPPGMCDPRAEQLTRQAQQAARLGQCGAVRSLGMRVDEIDPGCYAVQFAVIRCDETVTRPPASSNN